MKTATFVTLLVLFVSILVPLSVTITPSASAVFMVTDDVCDAADSVACFADADHPLLQPDGCTVCCPCCSGIAESADPQARQFVIPAAKDHPPEG